MGDGMDEPFKESLGCEVLLRGCLFQRRRIWGFGNWFFGGGLRGSLVG
jgi:hypothetical protein